MEEQNKKLEYNILFSVSTGISICNQKNDCSTPILTFKIKDYSIFVKDYKFIKDEKILDYGLEFIIKIETEDIQKTLIVLKNDVETILNLLCFSTLCYADKSYLDSIIEKSTSSEEHNGTFFVYPFKYGSKFHQLCLVDPEFFSQILQNYEKCDLEDKRRILRAITWLRKGLNDEKIDEFISNWIGLEILSKLIRKKYIGKIKKHDNWAGLKKVFKDYIGIDDKRFEKCKEDYRKGIVHGLQELNNDFIDEVEEFNPLLSKGLIACICKSLNLDDKIIYQTLKRNIKKERAPPYDIIKGKIKELPDFEEQIKQFPKFFPDIDKITFELIEGNKVTYQTKMQYDFRKTKGTLFKNEIQEVWVDEKSGIEKSDVEIE